MLAIALLPLMIVSIVKSQAVMNEALARSQAALVGETLRAVRQEVISIERAKSVAQALSRSAPLLLEDPARCNLMMRETLTDTQFSFAGYLDTTGFLPCSSAAAPFSFSPSATLDALVAGGEPMVAVNEQAPASGTSVFFASHPVFAADGTLAGFTTVSVPHRNLQQAGTQNSDATFLTLNADGVILTAPGSPSEAEHLLPQLAGGAEITTQPVSFSAKDRDGVERLYALVPVVTGELYALSSWPADRATGSVYLTSPALFPLLMWLASFVVAWVAASLFVTRPVLRLRTAMRGFAETRRTPLGKSFDAAPRELRDVADTFMGMTDGILRDEAKIEDAMRQKDILLREVHHRVKNNLQLIASIMSLQIRQTRSEEVKPILQSLRDRVNSLATIHRSLYQTTGQADIRMDEHLGEIVKQVVAMGAARQSAVNLTTDLVAIRLNPDQAVPLSLFVTEAITNALKYIGSSTKNPASLHVLLTAARNDAGEDTAELTVTNTITTKSAIADAASSSGLGSQLMEAFAQQLFGTFTATRETDQFRVHMTFPVEPLTAKE